MNSFFTTFACPFLIFFSVQPQEPTPSAPPSAAPSTAPFSAPVADALDDDDEELRAALAFSVNSGVDKMEGVEEAPSKLEVCLLDSS